MHPIILRFYVGGATVFPQRNDPTYNLCVGESGGRETGYRVVRQNQSEVCSMHTYGITRYLPCG
jgi:hypothetical protein